MRHKNLSEGREKDVQWLTDLLPQTFREYRTRISARIFCFNYQSAWLGPQLSRNRLEEIAIRLLDEIHNVRDKVSPTREENHQFVLTKMVSGWEFVKSSTDLYWPFIWWTGDRAGRSPGEFCGR